MNQHCPLHVRRAGRLRGDARPLVLLHGWSCHGGFFAPQLETLGRETLVLAPDLPGHGYSTNTRLRTIEAAADAVHTLLEEHDLREAVVVGWSMGALVAWSMIERHGEGRLASLVIEDMSPKVLNGPDWHLGTRNGLDPARNKVFMRALAAQWPRLAGATARRCLMADADPSLADWMEDEIRHADGEALCEMWTSLTQQDFRALVPEMRLPVTLAHGAGSQLYAPAVAQWLMQHLRRGRLVTFANSGHAPHLEESAHFSQILRDLVQNNTA